MSQQIAVERIAVERIAVEQIAVEQIAVKQIAAEQIAMRPQILRLNGGFMLKMEKIITMTTKRNDFSVLK